MGKSFWVLRGSIGLAFLCDTVMTEGGPTRRNTLVHGSVLVGSGILLTIMSVCLPSASSNDLNGCFLRLPSLIDACTCICGCSAVRQKLPLRCEQFAFFGWGIMFTIIRVYSNGASSASLKGEHPIIYRTPRHL